MFNLVCDTSPIQYLHQTGLIHLLRELAYGVYVPPAVSEELSVGRSNGVDLPGEKELSWLEAIHPQGEKDTRLLGDIGPGEAQVLMVALETQNFVAVLDDALARKRALLLDVPFTGTLGILLDAKTRGLITKVTPVLDQLESLQFRLAPHTRQLVLRKADELSE